MSSISGKGESDIEKVKEKLSKNREKILWDAQKIESGLEFLDYAKKHKVNKNKDKT